MSDTEKTKWSVVGDTYHFSWKMCLAQVMTQKDRYAEEAYSFNEGLDRKGCEREFFERIGEEYGFRVIWPVEEETK